MTILSSSVTSCCQMGDRLPQQQRWIGGVLAPLDTWHTGAGKNGQDERCTRGRETVRRNLSRCPCRTRHWPGPLAKKGYETRKAGGWRQALCNQEVKAGTWATNRTSETRKAKRQSLEQPEHYEDRTARQAGPSEPPPTHNRILEGGRGCLFIRKQCRQPHQESVAGRGLLSGAVKSPDVPLPAYSAITQD